MSAVCYCRMGATGPGRAGQWETGTPRRETGAVPRSTPAPSLAGVSIIYCRVRGRDSGSIPLVTKTKTKTKTCFKTGVENTTLTFWKFFSHTDRVFWERPRFSKKNIFYKKIPFEKKNL